MVTSIIMHIEVLNTMFITLASSSGRDTPQYKAILRSFETITNCIIATPSAKQAIIRKFKMESWIDVNTDCSEDDIVQCALERVQQNAFQFQQFISMLRNTTGMADIVRILEEKEKHYKMLSTNVSMLLVTFRCLASLNVYTNG